MNYDKTQIVRQRLVRKREDGCWEGRNVVGHKENGDSIFRSLDCCIAFSFFSFSGTQDSRSLLCDRRSACSNDNHRIGKSIRPPA